MIWSTMTYRLYWVNKSFKKLLLKTCPCHKVVVKPYLQLQEILSCLQHSLVGNLIQYFCEAVIRPVIMDSTCLCVQASSRRVWTTPARPTASSRFSACSTFSHRATTSREYSQQHQLPSCGVKYRYRIVTQVK